MIKTKLNSFYSFIKAIGVTATLNYIIQRYITRREMLSFYIPGVKNKIYLRRNSKDVNVFQQIFIKKDLQFLRGKDFKVCIDAGANIGLSTIYMKSLFPDCTVFCIEPETENIKMLEINTSKYTHINVIGKAMSENSEGLFLFDSGQGSDSFQTGKQNIDQTEAVRVASVGIKDIMIKYNLNYMDFVKIDIEGAENFCINYEALEWIKKTRLLAIEIHEHFVPGCTKNIKDLLADKFEFSASGEYSIFENLQPLDSRNF